MRTFALLMLVAVTAHAGVRDHACRTDRRDRFCTGDAALDRVLPLGATIPGGECSGQTITTKRGVSVSVSRSNSAYCTKSDGTLVLLSANQPRVSLVSGVPVLNVEGAGSTLVTSFSEDFGSWVAFAVTVTNPVVTVNTRTAPDGTLTADRVDFPDTTAGGLSRLTFTTGTDALSNTIMLSIYAQGVSGSGQFKIRVDGGTSGTLCGDVTCNFSTSLSRCSGAVTCPALAAGDKARVNVISVGTVGGSVYLWGYDAKISNVLTSYISSAMGSRAADNITVTTPTGVADVSGCAGATFFVSGINGFARVLGFGPAGPTPAYIANADTTVGIYDGTLAGGATVSSILNRTVDVVGSWSGSTKTVRADGTSSSSAYDGAMVAATTQIGGSGDVAEYLNGYVGNIRFGATTTACDR
jgi:hypothetical protein